MTEIASQSRFLHPALLSKLSRKHRLLLGRPLERWESTFMVKIRSSQLVVPRRLKACPKSAI